mmetsp:Transcript_8266/g.14961  ORF Transcript_8266/g.14961 Transcript_8266/m.14961 type:complete len:309 (+) Transcript_8266:105-1031(+)
MMMIKYPMMFKNILEKLRISLRSDTLKSSSHRKFNQIDSQYICRVQSSAKRLMQLIQSDSNPGIRVELRVISSSDHEMRLASELRTIRDQFGYISSTPQQVLLSQYNAQSNNNQILHTRSDFNGAHVTPIRVTGREENQERNKLAPWKHGDNFDSSAVPSALRKVERELRKRNAFALGDLRDITINYRGGGFFKLDPHLDPAEDGENVIIVGLCSDTVLTFTEGIDASNWKSPESIVTESWTPNDIDVKFPRRAAVHFCSDARWKLKHAIRSGIVLPNNTICDWWGSMNHIIPRNPERISVVFAFAKL